LVELKPPKKKWKSRIYLKQTERNSEVEANGITTVMNALNMARPDQHYYPLVCSRDHPTHWQAGTRTAYVSVSWFFQRVPETFIELESLST
jgi:hypothetical protein